MTLKFLTLAVLLSAISFSVSFAQRVLSPLEIHRDLLSGQKSDSCVTNFKPIFFDNFSYDKTDSSDKFFKKVYKHFFETDFLSFTDDTSYGLTINPLFVFETTSALDQPDKSKNLYTNSRGFEAYGYLGKKITFYSSFLENQAFVPSYIDSLISYSGELPGQGNVKAYKESGIDWAFSTAYLRYKPLKNLDFILGYGKQFIGSGYRSVILSDACFNYPFLRWNLSFGKFHYSGFWAVMQSQGHGYVLYPERKYKYSTFSIFTFKPSVKAEISFIEGIMWKNHKSNGSYTRNPDVMMLFPVTGLYSSIYGFDDDNKTLLALDFNYTVFNNIKFYSQFVYSGKEYEIVDETDSESVNDYGFQFGVNVFDIFFNKFDNLLWQFRFEADLVRNNNSVDNTFAHYGNYLSMPVSTGDAVEFNAYNYLSYKRVYGELRVRKYESDFFIKGEAGFILNKKTDWRLYCGAYKFQLDNLSGRYIVAGTKINVFNFNYDY